MLRISQISHEVPKICEFTLTRTLAGGLCEDHRPFNRFFDTSLRSQNSEKRSEYGNLNFKTKYFPERPSVRVLSL